MTHSNLLNAKKIVTNLDYGLKTTTLPKTNVGL